MLERFDSSEGAARIRDVTRVTSVGDKINTHVIQPSSEPKPDFEAMRRLVSQPEKRDKGTKPNERPKT